MKKLSLALGAIFLVMLAAGLVLLYPKLAAFADKDLPYEGDDPDRPAFLRTDLTEEEFLSRRSEYLGLKRGLSKDRESDPQDRQAAIRKMDEQQAELRAMPDSPEKSSLLADWIPIGPAPIPNGQTSGFSTPVSGRTISIAVHPTNANIVYVGTAQGGLYRSTDGGTNWTPLLDGALSLAIGAIAIAPSQPETIYVGTGEPNFSADSFFGVGL